MEIAGFTYLNYLLLWIFTLSVAQIDAKHFNKGQWIYDKQFRWLSRAAFVIALSLSYEPHIFEALGYAFIFYGIFDQALNQMRKGVGFWHRGSKGIDAIYPSDTIYIISKITFFVVGHLFLYLYVIGY